MAFGVKLNFTHQIFISNPNHSKTISLNVSYWNYFMKRIFLLILTHLMIVLAVNAQDYPDEPQVLIGDNIKNISGFGGFTMEFSSIRKEVRLSTGGGGAILLNQIFYIGGYGLNNHSETRLTNPFGGYQKMNVDFHHGGLWLGYIIKPNKLFHYNVNTKIGWGGIQMRDQNVPRETVLSDNIFAITPQVEGEINIAYWFRINASLGYRFVEGADNDYFQSGDFSSPTFAISFLFGWFKPYDISDVIRF